MPRSQNNIAIHYLVQACRISVPLVSRRMDMKRIRKEINRCHEFAVQDCVLVLIIERYRDAERQNMGSNHPSKTSP